MFVPYCAGVIDFKNHTLEPHATVPPPPPGKPDVTLAVYLTNNADPGQSIAAVLLGANNNKTLNATGMRERIPGMSRNDGANVTPQDGCAALPDGRKSAYCWTLNWVEFSGASNGVPLLFPDAQPGNRTYIQEVCAAVNCVDAGGVLTHAVVLHKSNTRLVSRCPPPAFFRASVRMGLYKNTHILTTFLL